MDLATFLWLVVGASPPILLAVLGETITERAGVINLSLEGSLLLSAMTAFAVALSTGSILIGALAAMAVGALVALLIAFAGLTLRQSQVAVGFVLTLLCRDLAYVLGNPVAHQAAADVTIQPLPLPLLKDIPLLGPALFDHNLLVYLTLLAVPGCWWWFYRTRSGLELRGLGERPESAYARGVNVVRRRYLYTVAGGALVGLGGAACSLLVKPGWSRPYGIENTGWIALAIVIFGNWHPLRAAAGALIFVGLQTLANTLLTWFPSVPNQLFPTLPFPLMIIALLLANVGNAEWLDRRMLTRLSPPSRRRALRLLRACSTTPPAALARVLQGE